MPSLERPAQTTRPNKLTWTPSNNLLKRFCVGARTTKTNPQGRSCQTSYTNVHKANLRSQLSIFDMGSFARGRPLPNDLPKGDDTDALKRPARTILHGHPHN